MKVVVVVVVVVVIIIIIIIIVIIIKLFFCLDAVPGCMNGAPNETWIEGAK